MSWLYASSAASTSGLLSVSASFLPTSRKRSMSSAESTTGSMVFGLRAVAMTFEPQRAR